MWTLLLGAGVEWRCVISVSYKSISRKGVSVCLDIMISPGV